MTLAKSLGSRLRARMTSASVESVYKAAAALPDLSDYDRLYEGFDSAHDSEHQRAVVAEAARLADIHAPKRKRLAELAARLHDIGLAEGREGHEIHGARMLEKDERLRKALSRRDFKQLVNAVRQHRASSGKPRSVIAKIVSDADRVASGSPQKALDRSARYHRVHSPDATDEEVLREAYMHIAGKYGPGGYGRRAYFPETMNRLDEIFNPIVEKAREYQKLAQSDDPWRDTVNATYGPTPGIRPLWRRSADLPTAAPRVPDRPRQGHQGPMWASTLQQVREQLPEHRFPQRVGQPTEESMARVGPRVLPMSPQQRLSPEVTEALHRALRTGRPLTRQQHEEIARYRESARRGPWQTGPTGRETAAWMPLGAQDSREDVLAHELTHAHDPALRGQQGEGLHFMTGADGTTFPASPFVPESPERTREEETPAMVAEHAYMTRKGLIDPSHVDDMALPREGQEDPLFSGWIYDHMRRYGPQLDPTTTDVTADDETAIRDWIRELREPGTAAHGRYRNWTDTVSRHLGQFGDQRGEVSTPDLPRDPRYSPAARARAQRFMADEAGRARQREELRRDWKHQTPEYRSHHEQWSHLTDLLDGDDDPLYQRR